MRLLITAILIASMLLLTACGGRGRGETVIVAGSTSVQPYAEILAEEYAKGYPGHSVDVQGGGSSAGIRAALSGTSDIGMSSRRLTGEEQQMWNIEIARDGLVLITHPRNPLSNLTLEQARGIYTGEITNWSEIGGNDSRIHVVAREEGSGTRGAFEEMVMDGERTQTVRYGSLYAAM
jgi:phosphate transport system substrate-binding protein